MKEQHQKNEVLANKRNEDTSLKRELADIDVRDRWEQLKNATQHVNKENI